MADDIEVVDESFVDVDDGAPEEKRPKLSSTLPVVLPKDIKETYLMEVGQEVDLEGYAGTVGRVHVDQKANKFKLDMKGLVYEGVVTKCSTFLVLEEQAQQLKITNIINHAIKANIVSNRLEDLSSGNLEFKDSSTVLADNTHKNSGASNVKKKKKIIKSKIKKG